MLRISFHQNRIARIDCHKTASSAPPLQGMTILLNRHPRAVAPEGPMGAVAHLSFVARMMVWLRLSPGRLNIKRCVRRQDVRVPTCG
jgi:hypothetical protein